MPSSFHPQSLSVSQMFIAHRLWRGGQPSKRLPTLKVEVQRTLEGRLFLNTWSVGKEDLHIYLWYVWDEDAAMAQIFESPFLRESFYSIHRSCSECIYMTWSIEICYAAWLEFCETINSSMWTKLQLFGLGVANVVGSAFSAYPTTGYNLILLPTISLFIEISFNLMFTCSSLAFQVTILWESWQKWPLCVHVARAFSIFLQTELFNVFIPPFSLREYSSELLGKTVNNQ